MADLPKQIDKRVRRAIVALDLPWEVVKKRNHYFLHVTNKPPICVANNSSRIDDWETQKTLSRIKKIHAQ